MKPQEMGGGWRTLALVGERFFVELFRAHSKEEKFVKIGPTLNFHKFLSKRRFGVWNFSVLSARMTA